MAHPGSTPENSTKPDLQHQAFDIVVRATARGDIDPLEARKLLEEVAPGYIQTVDPSVHHPTTKIKPAQPTE